MSDSAKTAKIGRSLAERLTRRVSYRIENAEWPVVFTHRALLLCEELTGTDMLTANLGTPAYSLLRALLFSALSVAGASHSLEDVGRTFTPRTINSVRKTILEAWMASMESPEPQKPESDSGGVAPVLTWPTAWARARYNLRMTDEEWLDSTPRMCGELHRVRLVQMQREELLVGIISSTVQNFSPLHPDKIVTPESFMLHKFPEEPFSGDSIMGQLRKMGAPVASLPPLPANQSPTT